MEKGSIGKEAEGAEGFGKAITIFLNGSFADISVSSYQPRPGEAEIQGCSVWLQNDTIHATA